MPRVSEMPRPGPLTGLELIPGLQGAGPAGNVGMPLLLTGAPFGGAVPVLRAPMTADMAATADADPGAGNIRWNHASPASATVLYISDDDADAADLAAPLAGLSVGGFVYVQGGAAYGDDPAARDNLQKWQVSSVTAATGYTKIGVTLVASSGALTDGDVLELTLQQPLPGGGGVVKTIVAGGGINVNSTDPENPVVSATGGGGGGSDNAPLTAPPTTGWSWVNQGSAQLTSTADYQRIEGGAAGVGPQIRGRFRAIPPTPCTVTAALRVTTLSLSYLSAGLALRESGSGRLVVFSSLSSPPNAILQYAKFGTPTVFSGDYRALIFNPGLFVWLRIKDDGTNRIVYVSTTGHQWLDYMSVSRTDFLTPDEIGFVSGCENHSALAFAPIVDLVSWKVE